MSHRHVTAEELHRMFGWSVVYVRKLAHRDGWRRYREGPRHPTRYRIEDVMDTRTRHRNSKS